jgi:thymidylate kinase
LRPRVLQALRDGDIVVLDRYWHDVMVDYSYGSELAEAPLALRWLLPDVDGIVILDVPEEEAFRRKIDAPDLEYLRDRRRLYADVASRYGGTVIDATPAPIEVHKDVLRAVLTHAGLS